MDIKSIEINSKIFPKIMTVILGKPYSTNTTNVGVSEPEIIADLPRTANLLYLQSLSTHDNADEIRLLEAYAYGLPISDDDYERLLNFIMVPISRNWNEGAGNDLFSPHGLHVITRNDGSRCLEIIPDAKQTIRAQTWECIIIDLLRKPVKDIIECFNFGEKYVRQSSNSSGNDELAFSLGCWKFSSDKAEQNLSTALRQAFMFTLVGYCYGDNKDQYNNFHDYFDAEFYKRVSLIYGLWNNLESLDTIEYIALYDSFHNLSGRNKTDLIKILRAILDDETIAFDERQTIKDRLIDGASDLHRNADATSVALEQVLIKPVVNFLILREKAKDTIKSIELLYNAGQYWDCANRCYYAMLFSLKALLEFKGLSSNWIPSGLKENETHTSLENALDNLVCQGILDTIDKASFDYVKDQRWKCDYYIYRFEKADAITCLRKAQSFCQKIESLTS